MVSELTPRIYKERKRFRLEGPTLPLAKYSRSELRWRIPSGCGSQPFGYDLGQKSMEIVAVKVQLKGDADRSQ
jgi:hypothetical protein